MCEPRNPANLGIQFTAFNISNLQRSYAEGTNLGLTGWVQNTKSGTVQGQLQGPSMKVKQMQEWLKTTGSPKSQITKAEFKNERKIDTLEHTNFKIVRT
uniref:Acylphosphatase-1 n=1 Tax=Paramormyrops kingsleyae TaxID=1676925 RepID=A0A3B3RDI3_9TELE